jgi:hypothetical protein
MAAILDPPTRTRQMQVGIASCGKVSGSALKTSTFMWTHLHMPEADAKMATQASVEAELARRSASWSPELRSKYDRYTKDARATWPTARSTMASHRPGGTATG